MLDSKREKVKMFTHKGQEIPQGLGLEERLGASWTGVRVQEQAAKERSFMKR